MPPAASFGDGFHHARGCAPTLLRGLQEVPFGKVGVSFAEELARGIGVVFGLVWSFAKHILRLLSAMRRTTGRYRSGNRSAIAPTLDERV